MMFLRVRDRPEITPYGLKFNFNAPLYIQLANDSRNFTIDRDDYYKVCFLVWRIEKSGVIVSKFRGKAIHLSYLISGIQGNVTHIDRDPLNNRKSNLREKRSEEESRKFHELYRWHYSRSELTPILKKPKKLIRPSNAIKKPTNLFKNSP